MITGAVKLDCIERLERMLVLIPDGELAERQAAKVEQILAVLDEIKKDYRALTNRAEAG